VHPGDLLFSPVANLSFVMPGLVPGIHVLLSVTRMAGTSTAKTRFAL
jgi:hypothetical protein